MSAFGQYGIISLKNPLLSAFGISAASRQEQMQKCGAFSAPFESVGEGVGLPNRERAASIAAAQ